MNDNPFEIKEEACASSPDHRRYLLIQAVDTETGEIVWAVGDDQICAVTRADFIRTPEIRYNDVLIREFPYKENTPESVGRWRPLIEELVKLTLAKYRTLDGLARAYPQWVPEETVLPFPRQALESAEYIIFHDNGICEMIPRAGSSKANSGPPPLIVGRSAEMLVHVKRDELLAIAAQTAKAAPKTATSEAVLGIHVEADSRRSMLTLTATNYEIVIRASMGASVEQSGSVVISAALFPAAIASLPEQGVDLETEHPGQLTIRSGHARFRLAALSGDKYPMPELPFPDDTLPVSGLRSLARNTLFAVAEDGVPSLPMKCVRLHVGPDGLKASASNGFCIMEADGDKQCKGQIELLLPARSLKVLASLSNDSDVYEMGVTGKSLVFWSGTLLFSARLVEGKFPNTRGVFEQFKCQYSVHLDAAEFIRALEVAESVSESNHRVELAFGEHEITVSAESACGRSSAPVKALVLNAPKQPFYYNSRKLLEYLRLEKEKITLEFDKFGLLVVRSGSTRYVQSPMRAPVQAAETGKAA